MKSIHCNENSLIIELENIDKVYKANGAHALKNMRLVVKRGTVHSVIGENGAGKTTLMKILCGIEKEDSGIIKINGQNVKISNPSDSYNLGIGMIYQHFRLIEEFTVAENILLGDELPAEVFFLSRKKRKRKIEKLLEDTGMVLEADKKIFDLSVGEKQIVEILRVLNRGAEILIFDEPTAVLGEIETKKLFQLIRNLKEKGKTIIFISHKLREVKEISDEITVMKNGSAVFSGSIDEFNLDFLSSAMSVGDFELKEGCEELPDENIMVIRDLKVIGSDKKTSLSGITLDIKKGEILGITGMSGNGQNVLAETIMGIRKTNSGEIFFKNTDVSGMTIRERREIGMRYVPEDRLKEGVSLESSIAANLVADKIHKREFTMNGSCSFLKLIKVNHVESYANFILKEYDIKCPDVKMPVGMLSGGNIQKVVIAREISDDSEFLVICEPTRGVDLNSTKFVYKKLLEMKKSGFTILLFSSNIEEVLFLTDRISVIYEGKLSEIYRNDKNLDLEIIRKKIAGY